MTAVIECKILASSFPGGAVSVEGDPSKDVW